MILVLQAPKHRQVAQSVVPKDIVQANLGPQRMISLVGSLSHFSRPGEAWPEDHRSTWDTRPAALLGVQDTCTAPNSKLLLQGTRTSTLPATACPVQR